MSTNLQRLLGASLQRSVDESGRLSYERLAEEIDEFLPDFLQARFEIAEIGLTPESRNQALETLLGERVDVLGYGSRLRRTFALAFSAAVVASLIWIAYLFTQGRSQKTLNPKAGPPIVNNAKDRRHAVPDVPPLKGLPPSGGGGLVTNAPENKSNRESPPKALRPRLDGHLMALRGEVTVTGTDGKPNRAKEGEEVFAGQTITTGDIGGALIRFIDGTQLTLGFSTKLHISSSTRDSGRRTRPALVRLDSGRLYASVVPSEQDRFKIVTPSATSEVIGTEFSLAALGKEADSETILQVKEGLVRFYNDKGEVLATAMTETKAVLGRSPEVPKRLRILSTERTGRITMFYRTVKPDELFLLYTLDPDPLSEVVTFYKDGKPIGESVVAHLPRSSRFLKAGLRPGDVIRSVNGISKGNLVASEIASNGVRVVKVDRDGRVLTFNILPATPAHRGEIYQYEIDVYQESLKLMAESKVGDAISKLSGIPSRARSAQAEFVLGLAYMLNENYESAYSHIRFAVAREPHRASYRYALGTLLLDIGNFKRGLEEKYRAVQLAPEEPRFTQGLIRSLVTVGRRSEALEVSHYAVLRWPDVPSILGARARALQGASPILAYEVAKSQVMLLPDGKAALYEFVLCAFALGRFQEAEAAARRLHQVQDRNLGKEHALLAHLLDLQKKHAESEYVARETLARYGENSAAYSVLISAVARQGRRAEALQIAQQALKQFPDDETIILSAARLLSVIGRHSEAAEMLSKSVRAGIPVDSAIYQLTAAALLFNQPSRRVEARPYLERARSLDPEESHTYEMLAWVYRDLKLWREARDAAERVLKVEPGNSNVASVYLDILKAQGDIERLASFAKKRIGQFPRDTAINRQIVLDLTEAKIHLDIALQAASLTVQLEPKSGDAHYVYAWALHQNGRLEEALVEYAVAIDLLTDVSYKVEAYVDAADCYEAVKNLNRAREMLQKALQLQPEHKRALEMLRRIGGNQPISEGFITALRFN